jgi:hypothetical protein|tara:strand:- start:1109 stop:1378 length:270 start_codon:yes stop_codon:yes gene_type:complete
MPRISSKKIEKIQEQILHHLFTISPESHFTNKIAEEIARDEEFTKTLLQDLKSKSLIIEINKNPKGQQYSRRQRWSLSPKAYDIYSKNQ